jgi:hypothetical protein
MMTTSKLDQWQSILRQIRQSFCSNQDSCAAVPQTRRGRSCPCENTAALFNPERRRMRRSDIDAGIRWRSRKRARVTTHGSRVEAVLDCGAIASARMRVAKAWLDPAK